MLFPNKVLIVLQQELRPSLGTSDQQPEILLTGLEIPVQHLEVFIPKVREDTLSLQELLGVTTDVICILMLLVPHQFMVLLPP
jgi:hypothetical protein